MQLETISLTEIKPHPRNYREHPEDQLTHLVESIKQHGLYRNIVIAKDGTILAGHGVALACKKMELKEVPVIRLDIDPEHPQALKVLAGDNEISHLGQIDDRALSEMLKEIKNTDISGLLGTGYDEQMLMNLLLVTRPASEIADINEAAEWVGMPSYDEGTNPPRLVVSFVNETDRNTFCEIIKAQIQTIYRQGRSWSAWYPDRPRDDVRSVKFKASAES